MDVLCYLCYSRDGCPMLSFIVLTGSFLKLFSRDGCPMLSLIVRTGSFLKLFSRDGCPMLSFILKSKMKINSGWRNPERNERVGGVPTSNHMSGRAIDIGTTYPIDTVDRAKFMWVLWRTAKKLPGKNAINDLDFRYMLEDADHSDNPNPYGTAKLAETGDTTRYSTRESVPDTDVRGATPQDLLPDGIPDYFNYASHLHSETFGDM